MAIHLENVNLIVPIKNINLCYPGGFDLFRAHYQDRFGKDFWHDLHLFRAGTANSEEIDAFIAFWQEKGLIPYFEHGQNGKRKWKDMCVIESSCAEPTLPCDWIEVDQEKNCVFLKKRPKGRVIGRDEMKLYYGSQ